MSPATKEWNIYSQDNGVVSNMFVYPIPASPLSGRFLVLTPDGVVVSSLGERRTADTRRRVPASTSQDLTAENVMSSQSANRPDCAQPDRPTSSPLQEPIRISVPVHDLGQGT